MYSLFKKLIPLLLIASACSKNYHLDEVAPDFKSDISNNTLRFFATCGFACSTPEVGSLELDFCYSDTVAVEAIGPIGCMLEPGGGGLRDKASNYAKAYNRLLKTHLDNTQKRQCPSGEHWDDAFLEMSDYARTHFNNATTVGSSLDHDKHFSVDFHVTTENPEYKTHDHEALMQVFCSTFQSHGIESLFQVKVSTSMRIEKIDDNWHWKDLGSYEFICQGARYEKQPSKNIPNPSQHTS